MSFKAPNHIAVLGGGLTGLSSAFHLSRRFPKSHISLIERQGRLGGWVRSERVGLRVPKPGREDVSVVLEAGPRTLRPNAKSVLELINLLGLKDQLITVPKSSAAARSRFLYVPPASTSNPTLQGLHSLPSSLSSLPFSPLFPLLFRSVASDAMKSDNLPEGVKDESFDSFLSRRFGAEFVQLLGSAIVHGIYATDSRNLSVRAAFPILWDAQDVGGGSVFRGLVRMAMRKGKKEKEGREYEVGDVGEVMKDVSVFSFRDGMQTLTRALEAYLDRERNVTIFRESGVQVIDVKKDEFEVYHDKGELIKASHVVSTLPLHVLHEILSRPKSMQVPPNLTANPTSTVRVVNFVFPGPPSSVHPEGFGYLIPRPLDGYPTTPTSPGILGTVFDSCSLHAQDSPAVDDYYRGSSHTKLTVMTGGPYPLAPLPSELSSSTSSAPSPFIQSILTSLQTHLGHPLPPPIHWRIWNNENCIPTLRPGHLDRVAQMRDSLSEALELKGRLEVAGAGVGGVSVGDCVESGKRAGEGW